MGTLFSVPTTMREWMRLVDRRLRVLEARKKWNAKGDGGLSAVLTVGAGLEVSGAGTPADPLVITVADTGWAAFTDYTPGANVTVSSFDARVLGGVFFFRVVATIASLAVPVNGDVGNTTVAVLDDAYRPTRIVGGITNGGVGRSTNGVVTTGGLLQVASMTPDATQTGSVTLTNTQISLAGSFPLG